MEGVVHSLTVAGVERLPYGSSLFGDLSVCIRSRADLCWLRSPMSIPRLVSSGVLALRGPQGEAIPLGRLPRCGSIAGFAPALPLHRMPGTILRAAFSGTCASEKARQAFAGERTGAFASSPSSNPKSGLGKPLLRTYQRWVSFKPATKSIGLNFRTR